MSSPLGERVWIFHAGALGDHVMIWPLVRALARQGAGVTVVAAGSHAALCEREVGRSLGAGCTRRVIGMDSEQERFTRLWRGAGAVRAEDVVRGVRTVVTFVAPPDALSGGHWHEGAAAMFPAAEIAFVDRRDREEGARDRAALWTRAGVVGHGAVAAVENPDGMIVLYPGAGNEDKRLSQEQWGGVARRLLMEASLGRAPIGLMLGRNEIERGERFDVICRTVNHHSRVSVIECPHPSALADVLRSARVFVGADTGPTHLAAQLGVPTLAIFGPTDARIWSPVGPRVRVLGATLPWALTQIESEMIVSEMLALLHSAEASGRAVSSG